MRLISIPLYGPGGSYNADNGSITLLTNQRGGFRQYANPLYTLIHEVVHMGIEDSIVQRFAVPHGLKERIVDTFVSIHFADELPDYRIQQMGNPAIDAELTDSEALERLHQIVEEFQAQD